MNIAGLNADDNCWLAQHVVRPLQARGASVFCFGSRARGDHQRYSDIDLMVVSDTDLSELLAVLRERIEESNLPYSVDLVEERAFEPTWRARYLQERKPLTARDELP